MLSSSRRCRCSDTLLGTLCPLVLALLLDGLVGGPDAGPGGGPLPLPVAASRGSELVRRSSAGEKEGKFDASFRGSAGGAAAGLVGCSAATDAEVVGAFCAGVPGPAQTAVSWSTGNRRLCAVDATYVAQRRVKRQQRFEQKCRYWAGATTKQMGLDYDDPRQGKRERRTACGWQQGRADDRQRRGQQRADLAPLAALVERRAARQDERLADRAVARTASAANHLRGGGADYCS